VQVATSFWIGPGVWQDLGPASSGFPQETVTVIAKPSSLEWRFGDGGKLTCHGPGSPTDLTCAHTYQQPSARVPGKRYPIHVVMSWDVYWTCAGANCQGQTGPTLLPAPIQMPGDALLEVGEIQAVS
jgi:hypothetical protein